MAETTMPWGVSPHSSKTRFASDPWLTPTLAALRDQRLKIAAVEAVISRIDTHLVHIPGGDGRDLGHEVDVGHNGCPETVGTQLPDDVSQIFTLAAALRRKAHDLSPGAADAFDLGHARSGVVGVGIGHRLAGDGMPAADRNRSDAHFARRTAHEFRKIHLFPRFWNHKDNASCAPRQIYLRPAGPSRGQTVKKESNDLEICKKSITFRDISKMRAS